MQKVKCLDHGHVILRNIAGPTRRQMRLFDADDVDPANSARMSFDNMDEDRPVEDDHKLADYLMRNWHTTPFEMIMVWIDMKLPIFVARQFVRHRTVSINEVSGRYVTLPAEWYIPETVGSKPKSAKQGQGDELHPNVANDFKMDLNKQCQFSYDDYLHYLENNVAPEHARMMLHLNHYTHWLWRQDLHNMMHFLSLRADSHAQVEAQIYARAIIDILRERLPVCMGLFDKYRKQK